MYGVLPWPGKGNGHGLETAAVADAAALCGSVLRADLLDAYPRLTRDDIQAVLGYAADSIAHEVIVLRVPGPKRWRREAGPGGVPLP